MSFIRRIGEDSSSNQQLILMRKKYFRNILEYNNSWQQQKKHEEVKAKQQSHQSFSKIVNKELEALQVEKQKVWSQKMNNQNILKDDYQKQMIEKSQKFKKEKEVDKEFLKMQNLENDKFMERRMLDYMKMYDRKSIRNSQNLHRRVKTEAEEHINPEMASYQDESATKKYYMGMQPEEQYRAKELKFNFPKREISQDPVPSTESMKTDRNELERMKRQFEHRRGRASQLPKIESQKILNNPFQLRPDSKRKGVNRCSQFRPKNNGIF